MTLETPEKFWKLNTHDKPSKLRKSTEIDSIWQWIPYTDNSFTVLLSKPFSGRETKTETLDFRSRDQDRDLDKMNLSAPESRDHGLEITSLAVSIPLIVDRALA